MACWPSGGGWQCHVGVGSAGDATEHEVSVRQADLDRLAPAGSDVETVVGEAFRFLLEREPRESILRRFELTHIARYFPEFEVEIRRRL